MHCYARTDGRTNRKPNAFCAIYRIDGSITTQHSQEEFTRPRNMPRWNAAITHGALIAYATTVFQKKSTFLLYFEHLCQKLTGFDNFCMLNPEKI